MRKSVINILPDDVANMIAAGEVVDRPASVVKELVENAIDAGASLVSVWVEDAGRELIAVEDDGSGMSEAEAVLSLKRHATSKIASAGDLERITTLGFRGEALPSIASVSRLAITTRIEEFLEAVRVEVVGGKEGSPQAAAGGKGTMIEVRDLFFNTPARRKFLKSDATEVKNIADILGRIALMHPSVGFELTSDGRRMLSLPPGQTLSQRAGDPAFSAVKLHWYSRSEAGKELTLAFAAPHEGKGRRDSMRFFVNRRAVSDRILFAASMEGYRGLLAEGRFPVLFLWLTLEPSEVDVNVHPAKREVRFADEGGIFRFVSSSVARALSEAPWLGSEREGGDVGSYGAPASDHLGRVAEALREYGKSAQAGGVTHSSQPHSGYGRSRSGFVPSSGQGSRHAPIPLTGLTDVTTDDLGPFTGLKYLGAVSASYLVFEDTVSGGLVIIDQHAAHERVLYEKFLAAARGRTPSQKLLIPIIVECGASSLGLLPERLEKLSSIGVLAEPFGGRSVSVVSAPPGLDSDEITAVVGDVLSVVTAEEAEGLKPIEERISARAACAAAVKAGRVMHHSEAVALLERLSKLENPTHCPHGRPLLARLGIERLESLFHRR